MGFDLLLILILLISMGMGVMRGFFRELLALVGWILAIWIAWEYAHLLAPYLGSGLSAAVKIWAGRVILFMCVLILALLVGNLVSIIVQRTALSVPDRSLGMLFGFVRGIILIGLVVMVAQILQMPDQPWWDDSKLVPYGTAVADWMQQFLDAGVDYIEGSMDF
ncbi:MAG: CvpA family protein [Gammaproteobacteria bacterium]|nr:CvpA family protein [Gammaproteobacteria bacterium]